jgi:2-iminobutanoate/2-iminopropanoate deaminase
MHNRLSLLYPIAVAALLTLCCAAATAGAERRIIMPKGATPGGNYSPGILVDGTLYVSGQAGEDKDGKIPANFDDEVKQALENIRVVLEAAGMAPSDVVSVQVYLTDGTRFPRFNALYREFFKDPRPTRTTVVVAKLVGDGHIEITTTARK